MKDNAKLNEAVKHAASGYNYCVQSCATTDLLGKTFHTVTQIDEKDYLFHQ